MRKLTVVISQAQGKNPAKQQLEEELVTALSSDENVEVALVPNLYDLSAEHSGTQFLRSIPGDVVVLSWLYPRGARWILDRQNVRGHEGVSLLESKSEEEIDEDAPAKKNGNGRHGHGDPKTPSGNGNGNGNGHSEVVDVRPVPNRKIYCLDLRDHSDAKVYLDEIRRIANESSMPLVDFFSFLKTQPQSERLEKYLRPLDLLAEQKPASAAKDPARMGADALRAQAKADASALAKKSGKLAGPASRGGGMEPDEKQKSVLDADASRKKQEVESARKKAQEEEAKPAKGRDRVAVRAEVAPPAAAEEQPAKKSVPLKSAKKPALAKAVVAKEAEAEHAKAKVDVAKSFVGRKHDEVADSSRVASAKLAESGKRAAVQTSSLVDAEAKVEAEEVRHAVQAAPKPPKAVRAKASVPSVEGPGGRAALTVRPKAEGKEAKGAPAEDKANARREAHVKKVELAGEAKIVAEGRVEQVKGRKVAVEAKAAAEPDVAKKASHAKAAASEAEAERAANDAWSAEAGLDRWSALVKALDEPGTRG